MWWLIIFVLASLISYIVYVYLQTVKDYEKQGLSFLRPWPLVGHLGSYILGTRGLVDIAGDHYHAFPKKRYIAFMMGASAEIMIRDPKLIKRILVKDFDVFSNHRPLLPEGIDPLWSSNLIGIRDVEKWHNVRSTLSPALTSSKLKTMFGLMKNVSKNFTAHFLKKQGVIELEMKQTFAKCISDFVTTTAFGIETDSLENPENPFYKNGISVGFFNAKQALKFILYMNFPNLLKIFGIKIFPPSIGEFFLSVIKETIQVREEQSIYRPDLINMFMEARKNKLVEEDPDQAMNVGFAEVQEEKITQTKPSKPNILLTDTDITAHAMIFYFGGFESSSTLISHLAYELALNPHVQEKLQKEVDKTLEKYDGDISYEALLGMKYLDMVISETLRKWPQFPGNDRQAMRPYTIEPEYPDEQPLYLKAGQIVMIPVYALHRDPKYYPEPDKFIPERFSDENKHNIVPYTYMPFGLGPRNCIGSRMALLQAKLITMEIVSKFEFVPIKRTKIPIQLSKRAMSLVPSDGFWLGMKAREEH